MGEVKMKECKYCGTKREDNAQFCPNCGASAVVSEEERAKALKEEQEEQKLRNAEKSKMSPRTRLIIILGSVVAVIIIAIIIIISAISAENNKVVAYGKTNNQISQEYDEVKSLYANGDYEKALELIDSIPSEYKDYDSVQKTKEEIVNSYLEEVIKKVDEYTFNGQYSDALALLTKAMETTNNNVSLKNKYDSVLSDCKDTYLQKAEDYAKAGNYDEAIATLETISGVINTDADIDSRILEYKKAIINDKLEEYEKSGDYASAIKYLEEELPNVSNDVDLTAKLNSYKKTYKANTLAEAENYSKNGKYDEALKILNSALNLLPNDEEINSAIEAYTPVNLFDLEYFNAHQDFGVNGPYEEKDNYGNIYSSSYYLETGISPCESWAEYNIDGKYSKLTGTFFLDFDYRTSEDKQVFKVYGDGRELYTGSVKAGDKPIQLNVDISGVRTLKIYYHTDYYPSGHFAPTSTASFSDMYLTK